jgi:putative FmdB family regulatory protein
MPIYEYRCEACGHALEAIQKMSDAALTDCPNCHRPALKKLISAAGFQLKGSGWYATDFKSNGKKSEPSEGGSGNKTHGCGGGTCGCAH